jgi:hypothetical protein
MHRKINQLIRVIGLSIGVSAALCASAVHAQSVGKAPTDHDIYCSGLVTDKAVPTTAYVISGEDSSYRLAYGPGDYIYINRGSAQGVQVGDQIDVIRPVSDEGVTKWFKYQAQLERAIGTTWSDIGRLRVVHVEEKVSVAEMNVTCDMAQRGDIILPFQSRPVPEFHNVPFNIFAAPSGKKTAMVVDVKNYTELASAGQIVYVNLGSSQGVQIGDYFRIFRYQGTHNDFMYQEKHFAYQVYGFGSTPVAYEWNNLPRQIVGEGIVLRTGPNASTVLVTDFRDGIYVGDYVEIE